MKSSPEMKNASVAVTTKASSVKNQPFKEGINMSNSTALTIGATSVRQVGGLFSLNDLHKEAGGESKHQPHEFLRIDQTRALIAELSNSGDSRNYVESKRGKYGGTYACKELVIAYAAWISAAFHLKVIRVFLAHVAHKAQAPSTAMTLADCGDKAKVAKFLLASRKRAAQHLARIDKELAIWELVDDRKTGVMPESQMREITTRLDRLSSLFHPSSSQFVDAIGIGRALRGLNPKLGMQEPGWVQAIPRIGQSFAEVAA